MIQNALVSFYYRNKSDVGYWGIKKELFIFQCFRGSKAQSGLCNMVFPFTVSTYSEENCAIMFQTMSSVGRHSFHNLLVSTQGLHENLCPRASSHCYKKLSAGSISWRFHRTSYYFFGDNSPVTKSLGETQFNCIQIIPQRHRDIYIIQPVDTCLVTRKKTTQEYF